MRTHNTRQTATKTSVNAPSASGEKKAFAYIRVSTCMQAQYGLSLEAQQAQIENYSKAYGIKLQGVYVDHDSAKSVTGRPEYQKMIAEIDKGKADLIISSALDRFSRSQRDFLDFRENYVETDRVHLVLMREGINTEVPHSRQHLGILVAFAQLERERTSERVKSVISFIRSQGGHYGKVPFGYTTVCDGRLKKLVPCPQNYKWVEKMKEWHAQGIGFDVIAQRLNENGAKPTYCSEWTKNNVYDYMRQEGIHRVRSEYGTAIVDKDKAYKIAYALKAEGRSLKFIASRLNKEGLRPAKANAFHCWSVQELLRSVIIHERSTAIGCAKYWHAQGKSLRDIALKLGEDGHKPKRGGQWFAQQVKQLLVA